MSNEKKKQQTVLMSLNESWGCQLIATWSNGLSFRKYVSKSMTWLFKELFIDVFQFVSQLIGS